MNTFQRNVINSFDLTRKDVYALYEHIKVLHTQISALQVDYAKHTCCKSESPRYIASNTGKKVHQETCFFVKRIKKQISFDTKKAAVKKGYTFCSCVVD
jgi:hypothetical protein